MRNEKYEKGEVLGEGTHGIVHKATEKATGMEVALKKVRLAKSREGVNMTALREIKILKGMKHTNITELRDAFSHKRNLTLAFEYLPSDLERVIKDKQVALQSAHIKAYLSMSLSALSFIHARRIVHRDIKPNNLLLSSEGTLKLADFGLARPLASPDERLTPHVLARWYKPPELLFGSQLYAYAIDVWALGCVLAELFLRRPWLPGDSDLDQLQKIFNARGTPEGGGNFKNAQYLPDYVRNEPVDAPPLAQLIPSAPSSALSMLDSMAQLDPMNRATSHDLANSDWLVNQIPRPCERRELPLSIPKRGTDSRKRKSEGGHAVDAVDNEVAALGHSATKAQRTEMETPQSVAMSANATINANKSNRAMSVSDDGTGHGPSLDGPPCLSSNDRAYLRKRKLDMDQQIMAEDGKEM